MRKLGFNLETHKKHFYVESHNKPDNVKYRDEIWSPRYFERELRMHRWITLPLEEAQKMIDEGRIRNGQGYRFLKDGQDFVDYHVDNHETFLERGTEMHEFGGLLSVRFPAGKLPILLFGQEEVIYKQFMSMWKAWTGPGGVKALCPKDEGIAVMISAIVGDDLGFGVDWNEELMRCVNDFCQGNKRDDKEAAVKLNGTTVKKDLQSSPFVVEFEHGMNNKGYWRYDNMVMQIEDCVDVLHAMMQDWLQKYDVHFVLNHLKNHNKHKPDGLNAKKMNSRFGGKQPKIRDSKLEDKDCFGQHPKTIKLFYSAKRPDTEADEYDAEDDPFVPYLGTEPLVETEFILLDGGRAREADVPTAYWRDESKEEEPDGVEVCASRERYQGGR